MNDASESSSHQDLQQEAAELGPWFHNLHLPNGLQTLPDHPLGDYPSFKWQQIAPLLPQDLSRWRVLDIGCNAGFYCFELARRGAQVTGIDTEPLYLKQASWAARQYGLAESIEFRQMQVYDLARTKEVYDLVCFLGVMYHLRHPLLALDIIAQRVSRLLLFQTMTTPGSEVYPQTLDGEIERREHFNDPGWPRMAFVEHSFAGDPTNWWIPNHACVEAMLRSCGFKVTTRPGPEIYLCTPVALPTDRREPLIRELCAATGQRYVRADQGETQ